MNVSVTGHIKKAKHCSSVFRQLNLFIFKQFKIISYGNYMNKFKTIFLLKKTWNSPPFMRRHCQSVNGTTQAG